MAVSETIIEDVGTVRIFRRRGLKYIRISIAADGSIRLSIPWYVSKAAGIRYLRSKSDWIRKHSQTRPVKPWADGRQLSRDYLLSLHTAPGSRSTRRKENGELKLYVPSGLSDSKNQKLISRHVKIFLKAEGEEKLTPKVRQIAAANGAKVNSVRIRSLRSRWGSCSRKKDITLNMALLNLPEKLEEYVIIHEVAHLKHLHHGPAFWEEVEKMAPDYKDRKKALRQFNPAIIP